MYIVVIVLQEVDFDLIPVRSAIDTSLVCVRILDREQLGISFFIPDLQLRSKVFRKRCHYHFNFNP